MKVAIIHPDLGLGGAERLIVDAAAELSRYGHTVEIHTAFYDPKRCFEETLPGNGSFSVHLSGSWFPRSLLGGKCLAICAYIRCILVTFALAWRNWFGRHNASSNAKFDVVIADQVSAVVPLARLLLRVPVLFYCHFPDLLLAPRVGAAGKFAVSRVAEPTNLKGAAVQVLRRAYRAVLDRIEEDTTGSADLILVNSRFTGGIFQDTFRRLHRRGVGVEVLYPAVHVPPAEALADAEAAWESQLDKDLVAFIKGRDQEGLGSGSGSKEGPAVFLSINRYERKKSIGLAIEALACLVKGGAGREKQDGKDSCATPPDVRLVIAGGYDTRVLENVQHLDELRQLSQSLRVAGRVKFITSFSDRQRSLLLAAARAVVYTPPLEHFGIVPLEAMAAMRPIIAVAAAGPLESVRDGVTGFLCEPAATAFSVAMAQLAGNPQLATDMGAAARRHVEDNFSRGVFGRRLETHLRGLLEEGLDMRLRQRSDEADGSRREKTA